jgi:hypothetical protein
LENPVVIAPVIVYTVLRAGYAAYLRAIFPCTDIAFDEKVPLNP